MMNLSNFRSLAALIMATLLSGVASAGTMPLGSFMGSTVSFDNLIENDGLPTAFTTQLYNTPTVVGDVLSFDVSAFDVTATTPGLPEVLDHSISFSVVAKPGQTISSVIIQESFFAETSGTGLVDGFYGGPVNTLNPAGVDSESASAGLSGTNSGVLTPAPLVFLFPHPVTQANFTLDNRLSAFIAQQGDLAHIVKRGLTVTVNPVPEPTSALMFACGCMGFVGVRRRRR